MVSHAHVARCVCRRAERAVLSLSEKEAIPEKALPYLNRLSDYLFVLSRKLTKDHQVAEIPWKPRMQEWFLTEKKHLQGCYKKLLLQKYYKEEKNVLDLRACFLLK